jgi:hypothetical protein
LPIVEITMIANSDCASVTSGREFSAMAVTPSELAIPFAARSEPPPDDSNATTGGTDGAAICLQKSDAASHVKMSVFCLTF